MERRTILILFAALVVIAFFLLYAILSESAQAMQAPPGPGPSVATDAGLLITVALCVSIGFWMSFADKEAKNWKRALLVVGLIFGSEAFFVFNFFETYSLAFDQLWYPAVYDNLIIAGDFLFAIAVILGLGAILAIILILDKRFAETDLKAEMERHRLPTEDSP